MYAVISTGGKQYRLKAGDFIDVERLAGDAGEQVVFDRVLFLGDDQTRMIGTPTLESARVLGTIVEQGKGEKLIVFKFKRRKMYRRKNGHRQLLTRVRIDTIEAAPEAGKSGAGTKTRRKAAVEKAPSSAPAAPEAGKPAAESDEAATKA